MQGYPLPVDRWNSFPSQNDLICNWEMVRWMLWGWISNFCIQKTVLFDLLWVHKFRNRNIICLSELILGHEDIIDGPLDPPFFLSVFWGCEFWILIRILLLDWEKVLKHLFHRCYWFILMFLIEITSNKNWFILMVWVEIIFHYLDWMDSISHIDRFCLQMGLHKYKLEVWLFLKREYALYIPLRSSIFEWLVARWNQFELVFFVEYSRSREIVWFFKELVIVSKLFHHLHKRNIGLRLITTNSVYFRHSNNISIDDLKMLLHKS